VYNKPSEGCVLWNDKDINIDWNVANPILSEKDLVGTPFKEFNSPF
jgi:dTDP-4-dehydrorhamnose 3,5-epimerase